MTRKRVLVADDNEDNRDLARQVLASGGFDVGLAADGAQAIELARSGGFALLLIDLSMPVVNGWDVSRTLKSDPLTRAIPIVACTAHAMSGDRERALAVGFDGYLAKPYRPRELIAFVEDFLGKGEPAPDGEWDVDLGGTA